MNGGNATEQRIKVGLRVDNNGKLAFFGLDDVNNDIPNGKRVMRIEEGRSIMLKSGESEALVKMRLTGFSVVVVIDSNGSHIQMHL